MALMDLNRISIDGGTQTRVALNEPAVAEYADALRDGAKLPPVVVFFDGSAHWLADGFHRFHAHRAARKASINVEIKPGTRRDAVLFSVGANATHGLRRTNEDKRRAVKTMLDDPEWSQWSDRKIAEQCGVGHPMVAAMRNPEVAEKQKSAKAEKQLPRQAMESDSTQADPVVDAAPVEEPAKTPKKVEHRAANDSSDELAEAAHAISELAEENEALRAQIAVGQMDAPEVERISAAEIIADLRAQVKTLEAELAAMRVSRDRFQSENRELMKQVGMNAKELKKLRAA